MSRPVPARDYLAHFDPELAHHRAWLLAVMERLVAHEPLVLLKKSDGSGLLELKTAMEFLTRLRQKSI